jgi:hypothetical protein
VLDSLSNIYIAGLTYGSLDGNTLTGNTDLFVTQFNSSGVKQWTKQLGVTGVNTGALGITADSSNNIYMTGYTSGGLDGNSLSGTRDLFVIKYNSSGTKQWTKQLGVSGQATIAYGISIDSSNNLFVAGYTNGGLDGNSLTGVYDLFVTKYNSSGTKQWTKQLGVAGASTFAFGIAIDSTNNFYLTGYTTGGLDGNTLSGNEDLFVIKYNSSGTKQWTKLLGVGVTTSYAEGHSIATDSASNVYITGYTNGGLDGNTLTGVQDSFVTKYNSSGIKQWSKQFGVSSKYTIGTGLLTDSTSNIYISGYTSGGLDGNTLTGAKDLFIAKYNSNGERQ